MKKVLALLLALVMVAALCACGSSAPAASAPASSGSTASAPASTASEPAAAKKTIYVLAPNPDHGWTGAIGVFAKAKVEELNAAGNYNVVLQTFATADDQIKQIEDIVANYKGDGSVGVAMLPAGGDVENAIRQLADAGIPYTATDRIIPSVKDSAVSNIKYDNVEIGAAAAAYLTEKGMKEGDKVVVIEGDGSSADTERTDGFNGYLKGELEYNGKKIDKAWSSLASVSYSGATGWNPANSQAYFETYLSNPNNADTKYIAGWDSGLSMAVFSALEGSAIDQATKDAFLANHPFITGCGGPKSMYLLLSGDYSAYPVAEQFGGIMDVTYPPAMIQDGIQALVDFFDGKDVPLENTQSAQCVTPENVADFMDKGFE